MADNYSFKDAGGNTVTHASEEISAGVHASKHVEVDDAGVAVAKAEDAAHSSGDKGVMALAVRKDSAAALAGADGDYIPLIVDANGRLHVVSAADAAAGDVAHDAADSGNPVKIGGKAATSAPSAVSAGDRVNAYFDTNGRLVINLAGVVDAGQAVKAASLPVVIASDQDTLAIGGAVAHDAADSGNPLKLGGKALTSDPTAVAAGDRVNAYFDAMGRLVVIPSAMYVSADISAVTADTVNTLRMTQYRELIVAPNMVRNQFFSNGIVPSPTDIQGSTSNWYSGYGTMAVTFFDGSDVGFTAATRYIQIPMYRFARGCQVGIFNNLGVSLGVKLRARITSYNTSNVSNGWHIYDGSVATANYLMFSTMPLHATANAAWVYVPQLNSPMDALIVELTPASDPTTGYITLAVQR